MCRVHLGLAAAIVVALGIATTACGKETTIDEATCPPGSTLTYESFGRDFMAANCQQCHGAPTTERKGAPSGYDFGSQADVQKWKTRIFSRAAADNVTMPPGPDDPPAEARTKLAEWLACGAP